MIYRLPSAEEDIDQGDLIDGCPVVDAPAFDVNEISAVQFRAATSRVVVLTQTCDLSSRKTVNVVCALVFDAQYLVDKQLLKSADLRGPIRAGRVFGWYFLPKSVDLNLPEMVVDFRQLHTVRLNVLMALCRQRKRRARVQPLYREHLARHFGDTYSRIGLPEPYGTE